MCWSLFPITGSRYTVLETFFPKIYILRQVIISCNFPYHEKHSTQGLARIRIQYMGRNCFYLWLSNGSLQLHKSICSWRVNDLPMSCYSKQITEGSCTCSRFYRVALISSYCSSSAFETLSLPPSVHSSYFFCYLSLLAFFTPPGSLTNGLQILVLCRTCGLIVIVLQPYGNSSATFNWRSSWRFCKFAENTISIPDEVHVNGLRELELAGDSS